MPTIFDIPKHLLHIDSKAEFIGWLKQLPVETWVKRDLVKMWMGVTGDTFDKVDYIKSGL